MATTTPQDASIRRQQSGIWAVFLFSAQRREEKMMFVRAERPRTEGWNAVQWSVSVLKGAQQWWWTCVMKWTVSLSSPTPFALPHSPHTTRPGELDSGTYSQGMLNLGERLGAVTVRRLSVRNSGRRKNIIIIRGQRGFSHSSEEQLFQYRRSFGGKMTSNNKCFH